MENAGVVWLTPASPWCCEPVKEYGAGACGIVNCCHEREPQNRDREAPPDDVVLSSWKEVV
jgi:hypothetical protein